MKMLKVLLIAAIIVYCNADERVDPSKWPDFRNYERVDNPPKSVDAPVISHDYRVWFRPVPSEPDDVNPPVVNVKGGKRKLILNFTSSSSKLQIDQSHTPETGENETVVTEEAPRFFKFVVTRPLIQKVHEVIIPKRKIVQEIRPVWEEVDIIVPKDEDEDKNTNRDRDSDRNRDTTSDDGRKGGSRQPAGDADASRRRPSIFGDSGRPSIGDGLRKTYFNGGYQ